MFVFKLHCVAEALSFRFFYVAIMNTIVFGRRVEIPTVKTVVCPSTSFIRFLVHEYFTSHRSKWHLVVIIWATEMSVGRNCWNCIGLSEEI
jgi:hypothetical protein